MRSRQIGEGVLGVIGGIRLPGGCNSISLIGGRKRRRTCRDFEGELPSESSDLGPG